MTDANRLVSAASDLMGLDRAQEALPYLEQAAAQHPTSPEAWNNLGCCLRDLNRIPDSLRCFDTALALKPGNSRSHYDRALSLLAAGDYDCGFAEYEHRWKAAGIDRPGDNDPAMLARFWRGGDIAGQRILLYAEQGLGDSIQFLRYARLAQERGAEVILEVQAPLRGLAEWLQPACRLGPGDASCDFDAHCPLMTLPFMCGSTLDTLPGPAVFVPPAAIRDRWEARIPRADRANVGLVWAGNASHSGDFRRSMSLRTLEPLLADRAVEFFSFQVGFGAGARHSMVDLAPELTAVTETAAALLRMDLVITVDTMVAHLAASLGVETWILLPFAADWRWLLDREDSPWYPSARLFRQPAPGDWRSVIARVQRELAARRC